MNTKSYSTDAYKSCVSFLKFCAQTIQVIIEREYTNSTILVSPIHLRTNNSITVILKSCHEFLTTSFQNKHVILKFVFNKLLIYS